MKLVPTQLGKKTLAALGEEAASMIMTHSFEALANRYGYALAWGREPVFALKTDYKKATSSPLTTTSLEGVSVSVKYFEPNDLGLFAVIECTIPLAEGGTIGMDLVITEKGVEKYISVEDIYGEAR